MLACIVGRPERKERMAMRKQGQPTKYPGVVCVGEKTYQVRGKIIDPRTGKQKEVMRLLHGLTAREAAHRRAELIEEAKRVTTPAERERIGDFARSWIKSKALKIDPSTVRTYADALEHHALPSLGDFYYDALTTRDVQAWVDQMLVAAKGSVKGGKKPKYSVTTVHGWFRAFRTMTRDAVVLLDLPRDPTLRISFPPMPEREDRNCISARELGRFLEAMKTDWPQHYALTVVLAFTGMRFCHASALKWEDLDEDDGVLRIRRKQRMGTVGPVSRKKRAPRELPVEPPVVEILREHRQRLVAEQAPGLAEGWMFPSADGTLRQPSSVNKAWTACAKAAGFADGSPSTDFATPSTT
jgi:integrase